VAVSGDLPTARPEYFDRPAEDRQLVRHKTYAIDELTPDEAAFDMDQLDYDLSDTLELSLAVPGEVRTGDYCTMGTDFLEKRSEPSA